MPRSRRAVLTTTAGVLAALAGCPQTPGSETPTADAPPSTHDGPTATVTPTRTSTDSPTDQPTATDTPSPTPSQTETVADTPTATESTSGGGASGGGNAGGGGSNGGGGSSDPATETPSATEVTTTIDTPEGDHPVRLSLSKATTTRVVGELRNVGDEPLAWMRAEVRFRLDDETLQANDFEVEQPAPDEAIPFDVRYTKNREPDSVSVRTRYAVTE